MAKAFSSPRSATFGVTRSGTSRRRTPLSFWSFAGMVGASRPHQLDDLGCREFLDVFYAKRDRTLDRAGPGSAGSCPPYTAASTLL
jgi:hypothetical protein